MFTFFHFINGVKSSNLFTKTEKKNSQKIRAHVGNFVERCPIWYYLYNFENVENSYGGVLLLAKLQALQVTLFRGCFSPFYKLYK